MTMNSPGPFDAPSVSTREKGQTDLKRAIHIIQKYFWIVVLFATSGTALSYLITKRQTPLYRTHATVIISSQLPSYLGSQIKSNLTEITDDYWYAKRYLETQFEVIRSRNTSYLTVQRLPGTLIYKMLGMKIIPERAPNSDEIQRATSILRSLISVIPVLESRIVKIQIIHADPELAMELANAVSETYIEENLERRISSTKSASSWLDNQLKTLKEKLDNADKALLEFKIVNGIMDISLVEKMSRISKIVMERTSYVENIERKVEFLTEKLNIFRRLKTKNPVIDPSVDFSGKELMLQLRSNYYTTYLKLQNEKVEFLEKHPNVIAQKKGLKVIKEQLSNEISLSESSLRGEYKLHLQVLSKSRAALQQGLGEAHALAKLEIEYLKLKRERDETSKLYDLVLARLKETGLAEELKTNNIRPLDRATKPGVPFTPRLSINLALGFALGLFAGFLLLVLLFYLDNTIKSQDELENYLGCPFLGYLPLLPPKPEDRKTRAYYIHEHPRSTVAEAIRSIRTNIVFTTPDNPLKTILVTSSMPLEGKTTISSYIAISMAMSGEKTLLVDGDMRKPTIHKTFGQKGLKGLSSLIVKKSTIEESIIETDIPSLHVLPCGPIPPNPAELEQSSQFSIVLNELSALYDKVIIDTPPVGLVTDPAIIGQLVDGVIVVTRYNKSTRPAIKYTRRALSGKIKIIGSIMNYVDSSKWGSKSYYYGGAKGKYYAYSYGYHSDEKNTDTEENKTDPSKKKSRKNKS
ncbi:MAG: polysaccharide biosynthesis tyrosine autokinase [Deltaproteobacteria bacterium]|nr:polysaccharide biosynthesis tyrosine autokinase [Deltaproteobacteria bacterium]